MIADCYLAAAHFYFLRTDEEEEEYIDARHALLEFRKLIPRALHEETLGTHLCLLLPQTVKSTTRWMARSQTTRCPTSSRTFSKPKMVVETTY